VDPKAFVDSLDSGQHIVQIISDAKKGKNIQFRFVNNGLLKGEHCVYLTHESPGAIKKQMISSGIDVEKFTGTNQLDIHNVSNLIGNTQGAIRGLENLFAELTKDLKESACRVVGRMIQDVSTDEGMADEMEIEQFVHSAINTFNGMVLCYYDYFQLPPAKASCLYQLCRCHHGAIISTHAEPGFAFRT